MITKQSVKFYKGIPFRIDSTNNYVNQNGISYQQFIWEEHKHQSVPEGYRVIYADGNSNNNLPYNLVLEEITTKVENTDKKSKAKSKKVVECINWHSSDEGRKWHSNQTKQQHIDGKFTHELICDCCNTKYTGRMHSKTGNHFCSSRCRIKYFRQHKKEIANEFQ